MRRRERAAGRRLNSPIPGQRGALRDEAPTGFGRKRLFFQILLECAASTRLFYRSSSGQNIPALRSIFVIPHQSSSNRRLATANRKRADGNAARPFYHLHLLSIYILFFSSLFLFQCKPGRLTTLNLIHIFFFFVFPHKIPFDLVNICEIWCPWNRYDKRHVVCRRTVAVTTFLHTHASNRTQ